MLYVILAKMWDGWLTYAAWLVVLRQACIRTWRRGFPARGELRRVFHHQEVVVRVAVEVTAQSLDLSAVACRQIDERLSRWRHTYTFYVLSFFQLFKKINKCLLKILSITSRSTFEMAETKSDVRSLCQILRIPRRLLAAGNRCNRFTCYYGQLLV